MKANEIVWKEICNYNMSANIRGGQYKQSMKWGSVFPSTKTQAKFFVKERIEMDVFNNKDVERVESLLNKYGIKGEFKYTASRRWVRLVNYDGFYIALKKEYMLENKRVKN